MVRCNVAPDDEQQAGDEKARRTSLAWVRRPMVKDFGKRHTHGYKRLKLGFFNDGGWGTGLCLTVGKRIFAIQGEL